MRYDGTGLKTPAKPELPSKKREPGTPGTVECPDCKVTVPSLPTNPDRPVRHSPGGFTVNFGKGRGPCPNSGASSTTAETLGAEWNLSEDGKPILNETQARARNLINTKIIAGRYDIPVTTLQQLIAKGHFVETSAYLDNKSMRALQRLFHAEEVTVWMRERRIRRKVRTGG